MKFRFASLLFLLSGAAFVNSPALSMKENDFYEDFGGSRILPNPYDPEEARLQGIVNARNLEDDFLRNEAATLQIITQNAAMFFPEDMNPANRESMTRFVMRAGPARTQALVQQKDVFFTDTMEGRTRVKIIRNILDSGISADGIGVIGAALRMHWATLFPADMVNEDRARIIEAAFRCDAAEIDNRVAAIEANAPVLLKDLKGRDYVKVIESALDIEASQINVRTEAIRWHEKTYFTGIKKEDVAELRVVLLKADALRIHGLAPSLDVFLRDIRYSNSRVQRINLLLRAEPDRVQALVKHKDTLLKGVDAWHLSRGLEAALALSDEELDRRVLAITNLLLPGNLCARLLGDSLNRLPEFHLEALLKKSVEEIRAWEAAVERNVPTLMIAHFAQSRVNTREAYSIMRELVDVSANEIDARSEGINLHAKVLFPPEINSDDDRTKVMATAIKVKRDQLDKILANVAAAYALVEGKADSRARAQVIIDTIKGIDKYSSELQLKLERELLLR